MSLQKTIRIFFLSVVAMTLIVLSANAQTGSMKGYQEIDANKLKSMMDMGDPLVVFPLSRIEFNDLHIAGSVNIPLASLQEGLPDNKEKPLVFYCLGMKCTASWRAAEKASQLGYKNVFAFRQGLPAWVNAGFPTVTIAKLPEIDIQQINTDSLMGMIDSDEDFVLLDVCLKRDAEKFWIDTPKRLHIPFDELESRLSDIPNNKKIVVICLKGKRSPTAIRYLTSKGYGNLVSINGGMQQWILEGKPVKTI